MRLTRSTVNICWVLVVFAAGLTHVWGKPVEMKRALAVADAWLAANPAPMVKNPNGTVWKSKDVRQFVGDSGEVLAYVVDLKPRGFIVVAADDDVEPILTFGTEGDFPAIRGPEDALSDLLASDIANRKKNKDLMPAAYKTFVADRWAKAEQQDDGRIIVQTVSPVVSPLITDLWGQGPSSAPFTYNYCIPNHYITGCVATAMGMIIHYYRYPPSGSCTRTIWLAGVPQTASFNDTFNYDLMPTSISGSSPLETILEVSKLLYDCGISVGMQYNTAANGGSGAYTTDVPWALKTAFGFGDALWKNGYDSNWATVLKDELSLGYPAELEIWDNSYPAGHAVVCDGWGTDGGSDRFHLNMGWDGYANNWYSVPGFSAGGYYWDQLTGYVYHIRKPADVPPATPTFTPDGCQCSAPIYVTIACSTTGAVIHYTMDGSDPTESAPVVTAPVLVDHTLTLKARAYLVGRPPSSIKSADYAIVRLASIRGLANGSNVSVPLCVVTAFLEDGRFYIEAEDRSCGILVYKSGYSVTPGTKVTLQGTVGTWTNGEKYIAASTVTANGSGSVDSVMLRNREVGGADWCYNALTGEGQKGVVYGRGVNNIGLLITTTGRVTYAGSGYFYIDDGCGLTDDSGYAGVKVLGPSSPPRFAPKQGSYVKVIGISTCYKAASPSTDLYRLIQAKGGTVMK